jgi:hypothetical protein
LFGHRRVRSACLSLFIVPGLLLVTSAPAAATGAQMTAPATMAAEPPPPPATDCSTVSLHKSQFPDVPKVDNRFLPYTPGTQIILDGSVIAADGSVHPHRIATTVTDVTKVIDGVPTIVIFDVDIQDGVVQESELFFVAQRNDGSVWTLGEYPELYDNGTLTGAPSTWIAGIAKAKAGQAMLARPAVGTPTYLQGLALKVGFKDCATVFQTGQHVCVTLKCYNDVLVVDEFAPLDVAGGHQRKSYAPGVGNIKVEAAGGVDPEALQATRAGVLCASAVAKVRKAVLAQDNRGYSVSPDVFARTPHAKQTLHAETC